MDRHSRRYRFPAALAVLALLLISAVGCQALLALAYVVKGTDEDADYSGLKEKKVVVVCRPLVGLQFRNEGAARELAERVSDLLKTKVSKIHIVEQSKVAAWTDENPWEEFVEVGKALKADMVVGIDLTSFGIYDGQTLYRGRAGVSVKVYEVESKKTVWSKPSQQALYPPNVSRPVADTTEADFRTEFVNYLAERIAQHFYAHDPYNEVGLDASAGQSAGQ